MIKVVDDWLLFRTYMTTGGLTTRRVCVLRSEIKEYGEPMDNDPAIPRSWLKTGSELYGVEATFDELHELMQSKEWEQKGGE